MLRIFIPSRGRPHRQPTLELLLSVGIKPIMVCTKSDPELLKYKALCKKHGLLIRVYDATSIREKRQFILDSHKGKMLMMDDDLTIFQRSVDGKKFQKIGRLGMKKLLKWCDKTLDKHAHVGLTDKFMSQTRPRGHVVGGRYNQILGYNTSMFPKKTHIRFRTMVSSDHDVNLQLTTNGLPPAITCEFSKDATYYAKGGCATWRTKEVEIAAHNELARLWPGIVTVRDDPSKIGGILVKFRWKKAFEMGQMTTGLL